MRAGSQWWACTNLAEACEELLEAVIVYRVRDATHKDLHRVRLTAAAAAAATTSSSTTSTAAAAAHAAANTAVAAHATSGEQGNGEPGRHPGVVAAHHSTITVGRAAHHAHAAPV